MSRKKDLADIDGEIAVDQEIIEFERIAGRHSYDMTRGEAR